MKHPVFYTLYQDRYIQLFPDGECGIWGQIVHHDHGGIVITITKTTKPFSQKTSMWEVGETYFISWSGLLFKYASEDEAKE